MALVFLFCVFWLPALGFLAFVTIGTLVAAWEWANLSGYTKRAEKALYMLLICAFILATSVWLELSFTSFSANPGRLQNFLVVSLAWWMVALLWIQGYPSSSILWGAKIIRLAMGMFVLVPAWLGLYFIRAQDQGSWLVFLLVSVVSSADIGAYFAGQRFGRRRLAESVSPGKSWEGLFGGLAASLVLALAVVWLWPQAQPGWIFTLVIVTALVSVLGDLLESMVKRHRGVKDSGLILPGHGGVLDRIDGITAAAPVFAFTLLISGLTVV